MEIILARHGRPKLGQKRWITPRQIADWIRGYDQSGVFIGSIPSASSEKAIRAAYIVSSPLPRSAQSAEALAPSRKITSQEVFREAGLPHARWNFPRLSASVWTLLFRVAWFWGYSANSESLSSASNRAQSAAMRLIELAEEHQSVFVMGHGIMTALIAKELVVKGWVGPNRPVHGYWQFRVYRN
ncbi:MAG TPA: histidine phosphatase family protein [Steroidobacteraceae bacterium]